ncbi:MAG: 1-deoxy-D-xylulose-5-phosphate synthase [Kiritimatiellae bacterium]|jgi:hypothetical protein|nr:1-deoxy-D-xylulose-5-phosphate synthase [Kiritimatiellia bacterium]
MKEKLMYMELKQEGSTTKDSGPAKICRMKIGKGAINLHYQGKTYHQVNRPAGCGNYEDQETGEMCWICAPHKKGADRCPWAKKSPVFIDEDIREEYWAKIRNEPKKRLNART